MDDSQVDGGSPEPSSAEKGPDPVQVSKDKPEPTPVPVAEPPLNIEEEKPPVVPRISCIALLDADMSFAPLIGSKGSTLRLRRASTILC